MEDRPTAKPPHEYFLYSGNDEALIRQGKWKYHHGKLYDLSVDISEKNNVADKFPKVAKRLQLLAKEKVGEIKSQMRPPGRYVSIADNPG